MLQPVQRFLRAIDGENVAPRPWWLRDRGGPSRGKPAEGGVGSVELLDLLDRGAAAEVGETADQLQVDQVAGGERVGLAAAEEAEALHGPGTDLAHREQAAVGIRLAGIAATGGDLAGDGAQGDRPVQRQP